MYKVFEVNTMSVLSRLNLEKIGSLSNDVFERRMSTRSEAFFLFICLDAIKFSLLTLFSLSKTIYPKVLIKPQSAQRCKKSTSG